MLSNTASAPPLSRPPTLIRAAKCSCGHVYTPAQFAGLRKAGRIKNFGEAPDVEVRLCNWCGSSCSREVA